MARLDVLDEFQRRLVAIDRTRHKMELLFTAGHVGVGDIAAVYESLFLRAVSGFENFCEGLFWGILQGNIHYPRARNVAPRIAYNTAIRELVHQDNQYLTWLPYRNTERRADMCLVKGRPFTVLDDADKSRIQTIVTIRNAIAHKSDHASSEFKRKVIGSQNLLKSEKTPAGWLRSQITNSPQQSRFDVYIWALGAAATRLRDGL